jgi:hypothetical protein
MYGPSQYYQRMVVQETPYMSNWMTDTNHLRQYLSADIQPQMIDRMVNKLFIQRQSNPTPLLTALESRSETTMLLTGESDSWQWEMDRQVVPAEIVANLESGNSTPGRNKEPFRLVVDRPWFSDGDVIACDAFSGKQIRVVDNGVQVTPGGVILTVQLVTDDASEFYPPEFLEVGQQYRQLYFIGGEYNDKGSKPIHAGKMRLMNSLGGEIRTELGITDWADALTLTVSSVTFDQNGKPVKVNDARWFKRAELAAWEKHRRMKENYLMFGVAGSNLSAASAYDVKTSMGLWQMLHLGNVNYFSDLSMDVMEESIGDLFYNRVDASQRNVELWTGEAGFKLFSSAVAQKMFGLGALIPAEKFIDGRGMNMGFGYQFKSYEMVNGGRITLKHLPALDAYNTKAERGKGRYSRQSATFIGLDMSPDGIENVKVVKRSTRQDDYWGYLPGTCTPYGPTKGGISVNKKAGYEMWINSRVGLHMADVTKSFILKPTFEL